MEWVMKIRDRLRVLLKREQFDREFEEEMQFHRELQVEAHRENGMSADEAEMAARRQFGNPTRLREAGWHAWGWAPLERIFQDLRSTVRTIRRSPGFALSVALLLGMAIWMNTTVYSVIHAVMLAPLPFDHPEELVRLYEAKSGQDSSLPKSFVCPANFADWRADNRSFQEMAAFAPVSLTLQVDNGMEPEDGAVVTANFFRLLRTRPLVGRDFIPEDIADMGDLQSSIQNVRVAIISYGFWQRQFGADPSVIGASLILRNSASIGEGFVTVRIVGVMPGALASARSSLCASDIWLPIMIAENEGSDKGRFLRVVARQRPGIPNRQAQAEMDVIASRLQTKRPKDNAGWGIRVVDLRDTVPGSYRASLLTLAGAVVVILLIACANVANLMLARGAARFREMAIQAAIGAGRFRLVAQMATESLVLALAGGALGFVLSLASIRSLILLAPPNLPRIGEARIDLPVFWFCLAVALVTGLLCGVVPALWVSRFDLGATLKEGGTVSAGASIGVFSRSLVVFEITLSFVLLVGAGLLARSFVSVQMIKFGFQSDHVLAVELHSNLRNVDLLPHLQRIPGIEAVAEGAIPPSTRLSWSYTADDKTTAVFCIYDRVDMQYFRILRIPLLAGRMFSESDHAGAPSVAILNRTAARLTWPGEDPIGKRIHMGETTLSVVGVVGDAPNSGGQFGVQPEVYVSRLQTKYWPTSLLIRTEGKANVAAPAVRAAIRSLNGGIVITYMDTLENRLANITAGLRFNTLLMSIFAALAFLLAVSGVYSLMSYTVTLRTREMSIRMAMGADRADIILLVLRTGTMLVGIGVILGLAGALVAARFVSSLLYQVKPRDPISFIVASALLAAAALAASYVPARRAASGEIIETLRQE